LPDGIHRLRSCHRDLSHAGSRPFGPGPIVTNLEELILLEAERLKSEEADEADEFARDEMEEVNMLAVSLLSDFMSMAGHD
jgi:hypothetical protein